MKIYNMKNFVNGKFIYRIGYMVSLLIVVIMFFTNLSAKIDCALGIAFSAIFAISHTQFLHKKMLKENKEYQTNVFDERNILIKEKSGNIGNMIMLVLLGIVTVLFIILDYIIPAIVIGGLIFLQPIILIFISNALEKHM